MGPELDKPTESKSSEILFRLKGAILGCTLAVTGDLSKQKRGVSFYTKCRGINCT